MEKYLIELLESNNRVIVPDLGAFIIRQQEPRELVFNDLLAFNDGMLTAHIKQEEGISMSKAQAKIEAFVDQVKKVLTKGDIFYLENLGYLKMDDSSKIEFSVSRFPTASAEIISAATLSQQEEEILEEKQATADEETVVEEAPVLETPEEEAPEAEPPEEEAPVPEAPEEEAPEAELPEEEAPEIKTQVAESPEKETPVEETIEWEEAHKAPDTVTENGSFTLEDQSADIEVDAADDEPLIPDREEPPFLIEEQQQQEERKAKVVGTSQARLEAAAAAATEEDNLESRQEPLPEPETSLPYYYEKERSIRNIWPWVGGAIALIVILIVAAWFFFPEEFNRILGGKSTEMAPTEETVTEEPSTALQEATGGQETPTAAATEQDETNAGSERPGSITEEEPGETESEQTAEKPATKTVEETAPGPESTEPPAVHTRKYYIVAGMFSSRANAVNYVNTLKAQGYDAEVFGQKNNLYGVSFSSYESRATATRELNRIREESDRDAWLLYY